MISGIYEGNYTKKHMRICSKIIRFKGEELQNWSHTPQYAYKEHIKRELNPMVHRD